MEALAASLEEAAAEEPAGADELAGAEEEPPEPGRLMGTPACWQVCWTTLFTARTKSSVRC